MKNAPCGDVVQKVARRAAHICTGGPPLAVSRSVVIHASVGFVLASEQRDLDRVRLHKLSAQSTHIFAIVVTFFSAFSKIYKGIHQM